MTADWLPWIAVLLLVVVAVVLIVIIVRGGGFKRLWRKGADADAAARAQAPGELAPPATVSAAFKIARRELRRLVAGGRGPAEVPWTLALGLGGEALAPLLPPPTVAQHEISWIDEESLRAVGTVSFRTGGVVVGFEDGLVDSPGADRRLAELLRQVERLRPVRPVDSIAIVIPWSFLARAIHDEAGRDAVAARGRELYRLVLAVQQRTGWRVPIHILLSGCEQIPGFSAYAEAVLERSNEPVIGWPAPKSLDTMFETRWLDEAFVALRETLSEQQFHLLMGIGDSDLADDVLLLPSRLAAIRPVLELLLTAMLERSAYHEGFMLRGVFLTGETEGRDDDGSIEEPAEETIVTDELLITELAPDPEEAAAPLPLPIVTEVTIVETAAAPTVPPPAQRLAQTLFLDKIFPESQLAQPAYGELTRRHRLVRRTQVALVAVGILFVLGIAGIRYQAAQEMPPVAQLLADIIDIEHRSTDRNNLTRDKVTGACIEGAAAATRSSGRKQSSIALLDRMSQIGVNHVSTWLAPTSFLTRTDQRVENAIKKSLHEVVFEAIAESLATPAGLERLMRRNVPTPAAESFWPMTVRNVVDYNKTYRLVRALEHASRNDPALVANFAEIVRYALGESLPAGFERNNELYAGGIANYALPCIDSDVVHANMLAIVARNYNQRIDYLYLRTELAASIASIGRLLDGGKIDETTLRSLIDAIDTMRGELAIPGRYNWIYEDPDNLAMLPVDGLGGMEVIDSVVLENLQADSRQRVVKAATALRDASLYGAPMLAKAGEVEDLPPPAAAGPATLPALPAAAAATAAASPAGASPAPVLSSAMKDTHGYLEMLFAQPFMGTPPVTLAYSVGWDYARLHGAGDTAKAYAAFAAVTGDHTPPALRAAVLEIARDHVTAQLDQAVDQATPSAPGRSYIPDSEASAFIQALPMLLATRNVLAEVGAGRASSLLDARVGERAGQLLFIADGQLNADRGPYAVDPAGLAAWNGTGSLAAAAFGVDTLDDLVGTLPQRRGVVATIARGRVAPLLSYLHDPGTAPANVALVRKWQGIVDTLQAYDAGSPNNSLSRLERFMTVDIDRLQQECARIRGSRSTMGDYFAAQQAAIAARVGSRCGSFARTDARSQFERLRQAFNSTLANRFPFGGDRSPPADPGAVQSFFATYGSALGPLKAQIEAQQPGSEAAAVLGELERVQAALAPMLAGPGPLSYKVDVAFLTDPTQAQGQQQIVEARLGASPADEAKMPHGPPGFNWTMGQTVTLTLRWALNAPSLPTEGITDDAGRCLPPPGGGIAHVRVTETWALLRLIARHRAQAADDPDDGAEGGIPLAFSIPVCANLQRAAGGDDRPGPARVLVRVSLSALIRTPDKPDRLVPVTLPVFPRSIPPLDGWASQR